ncbi:MAG: hypothetical protein ICV60_08495 [Pyrinomonadaceae bacterium]|nr:hypothetical protein [Pyrinomonadaceae bacterium]
MAEEKRGEGQRDSDGGSGSSSSGTEQQTGDPGRTPGTAEGDRETVEEDLESRES